MAGNEAWLANPQGKIPKNSLCPTCAKYNARNTTCHALVVRDERILMIKRGGNPMKGWWALPAGYIDWDETVEECTLRELKEEAGVDGEIVGLLGVYSDPKRDEDGRQNIAIVYEVKVRNESMALAGDDAAETVWFSLDALPEQIAFDHRQIISDYLERKTKN